MSLYSELAGHFAAHGFTYDRPDGSEFVPNEKDFEAILDKVKDRIESYEQEHADAEGVQLQVGRLIVRKEEGHYDVYVYMGSVGE